MRLNKDDATYQNDAKTLQKQVTRQRQHDMGDELDEPKTVSNTTPLEDMRLISNK